MKGIGDKRELQSGAPRSSMPSMNGEVGDLMREAFKEHLNVFGEDFHAAGETKRAVFSDHKGVMKITFPPGEFASPSGSITKRWATKETWRAFPQARAGFLIQDCT